MCRDRLDQFCDRHDLVIRAALLIVPAVIYASYIAWAADRFDFICGSFGNYKSFAPGIAVWMVYFLVLPLFLWRKFRRKHGPLIWLVMLVLWELQIVVAVVDKQLLRRRVDAARRRALDRGGTRGAAMRDGGRRVLRGARRVPLDRAGAAPGARRALLRRRRRRRGVAEVCAVGRGGRGPASSSSFLYSG